MLFCSKRSGTKPCQRSQPDRCTCDQNPFPIPHEILSRLGILPRFFIPEISSHDLKVRSTYPKHGGKRWLVREGTSKISHQPEKLWRGYVSFTIQKKMRLGKAWFLSAGCLMHVFFFEGFYCLLHEMVPKAAFLLNKPLRKKHQNCIGQRSHIQKNPWNNQKAHNCSTLNWKCVHSSWGPHWSRRTERHGDDILC